ncbi:MAG: aminopeptidase [Bacteroidaceae bacterium]|nr:aminopeptidase [Bacteroidaceae bacterium]
MKKIRIFLILLLMPLMAIADKVMEQKLAALSNVVEAKEVADEAGFDSRYILKVKQPLSHKDPSKGYFNQRVIVMHRGMDRPTLVITEGYGAGYAAGPRYNNELSTYFNTNIVFVEHRFFQESKPEPCDWQYLRDEDAMADLHEVVTALKTLYPGKWISTGISKGGETCMEYRSYYPEDVDVSVPYVGPVCYGVIDGRHEPFLRKVGTAADRKSIENFQLAVLKKKAEFMPRFKQLCDEKNLKFYIPLEDVYDYCVLEYSFSIWQWGTPTSRIPEATAPDDVLFNHLIKIVGPDYFATTGNTEFFAQAYRELGYYGYDIKPFKKYLSIKSAKHYLRDVMLPPELRNVKFDKTVSKHITQYLKKNDPQMICIYGEIDPWTAAGVTWLQKYPKNNLKVYVKPRGSHSTRINNMPPEQRDEILSTLSRWLGEPVNKQP